MVLVYKIKVFLITSIFPASLVCVSFFYSEQEVDRNNIEENDRRNNTR